MDYITNSTLVYLHINYNYPVNFHNFLIETSINILTNYHWHDNNITMVYFLPFLQAPFGDLLWMNSSPHPCLSL